MHVRRSVAHVAVSSPEWTKSQFLENVAEFKHMTTTVTPRNYIHKENTEFEACLLPFGSGSFVFSPSS
jgi:hypothetical protein